MSAREPFTSWWGREGMKDSLATQLMLCFRGAHSLEVALCQVLVLPGSLLHLLICFPLPLLCRCLFGFRIHRGSVFAKQQSESSWPLPRD